MKNPKKFRRQRERFQVPSECSFCKSKTDPEYMDVSTLSNFLTERGKIISMQRSGLCNHHQRRLTDEIKRARYLALLPYIV